MKKLFINFIVIQTLIFITIPIAVGINKKLSEQDSLAIIELYNNGVSAGRLSDFEEAINNFTKVYELRKKAFGPNSYKLATPLTNLGIQYKNLGNLDKAIEAYKNAELLYIKEFGNEYSNLGVVYVNLGNIYGLNGDFLKYLEYEKNAYRILKKDSLDERYSENFQDSKYNIADAQLKLGNTKEAIKYALANLKSTPPYLQPRLYDLIANAYQKENNYVLAESYYLKAIASWISLYGEKNSELISEYLAYSAFLMAKKDYEKALLFSTKARDIVVKFFSEKSTNYAEVQSNFGDYYYLKNLEAHQMEDFRIQRKKYLGEAIQYYQNATIALVDSFDNKDPFTNPNLRNVRSEIQLVEVLKKKALAMEKMSDILLSEFNKDGFYRYAVASLNTLSKSVDLIHSLQIGFDSEESRLFLSQNQESTFDETMRIAYKLYEQTNKTEFLERAFGFSERSKSSNLLASVKDTKAKEFGGIPDTLIERENFLKSSIANYTSMLFEENHLDKPDSQKLNLYSAKIFRYNEEYSKMIESFEKTYPEYYALKYENKVAEINEIQDRLKSKEAVIEYYINEPENKDEFGELYRFVITKDSVSFTKKNIDYRFEKTIQAVHDFLVSPNYLNTKKKDFTAYARSAYSLYEQLLKPVDRRIQGKSLTIIPHGKLSYIPFDALISSMPDTTVMNFRNLSYLVKDFVIDYSYSATLSNSYFKNEKSGNKNLIIFSPKYNSDETRVDAQTSAKYHFTPLIGAKDEVRGISKFIHADLFVDDKAQEESFKSKATDYDILHLAMHTVINDTVPMFSKLVFSDPDIKSDEDGYLNTFEIYNMKLKARLAVLSACETGSGKLQKGEGVMSMARGFIYAGCPSIVMTLWQVEDKSGVQIMEDFYSYLSKGKRKDVALRMAKLNHLNRADQLTAHPHFWLGYVNIGNPEPLYTSKDIYFVIFLFVIALLVFADWYIRKRPRKSRGLNG